MTRPISPRYHRRSDGSRLIYTFVVLQLSQALPNAEVSSRVGLDVGNVGFSQWLDGLRITKCNYISRGVHTLPSTGEVNIFWVRMISVYLRNVVLLRCWVVITV